MMPASRILAVCAFLLPLLAQAQENNAVPDAQPAWSASASLLSYWLPDDADYSSPTLSADRDRLHLEARYNYENLDTASLWIGYNRSFGDTIAVDFTPMVGGVFGDTRGFAPGYHLSIAWQTLDFYSEGEYVFDRDDRAGSFFYNWSEVGWSPVTWLRTGLVAQRTRAYQSERDIQRGLLLGISLGRLALSGYVFNPDHADPIWILSISLDL
jgi:hypothetical protein